MIPPINIDEITVVASFRPNGPLGNIVSGFWSSEKLAAAQPSDDPNDAANKFPGEIFR